MSLKQARQQEHNRRLRDYLFAYDPDLGLDDSAYWTHSCGAAFYVGGNAIHKEGCITANGYVGCTYHFGPRQIEFAKSRAEHQKDDIASLLSSPLTLAILKVKFPHLV